MIHVPGFQLIGPNVLSHRPDLLPPTTPENEDVTLLPPFLFVNLIDTSLSHHIQSSSASDPLVLQVLQSMDRSIPPAFCSCLSDWQYTEGILIYKGCVYILPNPSLQQAILARCHDHETAGHLGYLKTCQLVASEFWWPGLASFICKYVKGCAVCQQNKSNTHPTIPPLTPICLASTYPFQQISCDLITNPPLSASFDSLLDMVDHGLTKGVILCPTKKTITAEGIANLFFHKVFLHFSLYDTIISDRGPQFASAFAKELGKLLNYDLPLSTAYHLQSDGELNGSTKKSKPTFRSSVKIIPPHERIQYLMPNLSTTTTHTLSPHNRYSSSWWNMNPMPYLLLQSVLFLNGLSTLSWVHLILSRHVIILSQGTLSFIYFLMRSLSPLCYHSLHLISVLCMAMPSFLFFHSDALRITHVYASILCTAYLISASTAQGLGFSLCIQYQ